MYNAILAKNYEAIVFAHKHDAFLDCDCVCTALATNDFQIAKYIYNAWLAHPAYEKNKWLTVFAQTDEIRKFMMSKFD